MKRAIAAAILFAPLLMTGAQSPQNSQNSEATQSKPPQGQKPPEPVLQTPAAVDPAKMAEAPGGKPTLQAPTNYVIGAEDILHVNVWEDARFSGSFLVLPDGTINLPFFGPLKAADLTPPQLQAAIDKALTSCCLQASHASVQIEAVHSKKLYFDGEGISTGSLDLMVPLRLMEAISTKGGFKEFADSKHIRIIRDGKPFVVAGHKSINYRDLTSGKHPELNILMLPNDHIIVN